jgi:hypothetical protein
MARYLVVANQLGDDALLAVVSERSSRGAVRVFVLVPATPPSGGLTWTESQASLLAHDRLERGLKSMADIGVDAEGEVGDPDPFLAVQDVIRDERFDEIIVSGLGRGVPRGSRTHLLPRLMAAVNVPVTYVASPPEREVKERTLRQVPLFATLSKRHLRALVKASIAREYLTGDLIVSAGQSGSDLFVILDGRVRVRHEGRTVATLAAADFFGEISLLDPGPRTAEVVADGPTRCIRLAGVDFWEVLEADPGLAIALLRRLGQRMREIVQPLAD